MKKTDYLQKIYERNPETGDYIIEISLNRYTDIFNDWDHSSIMKRDLAPDLKAFLESCSADIPVKYGINLYFYIQVDTCSSEIEEKIKQKLRSHYSFYLRGKERHLKQSYRMTLVYILASFTFLTVSFFLESNVRDNIFYKIIPTGLNIGGWVFLWEAISFFFFKRAKVYQQAKEYFRLANAPIFFRYETRYK